MNEERRAIRIRGVVQGVGFRPAMFRLADAAGVTGFVRNDREGVWIEIQGAPVAVERFVAGVDGAAPPTARIDAIEISRVAARGASTAEREFAITESPAAVSGARAAAAIPADLAPCGDCLRELSDPNDRRYRYPFINCTACGPRFTIVRAIPYDRPGTTMSVFPMCPACRREYDDPRDRRFHAEPNACPLCGPTARLVDTGGVLATGDGAVRAAAAALAAGSIVAIKGAGGFALAVDARNDGAVARLRRRKRRPDKPFAVMVRSLAEAERIAVIDPAARDLLCSPARPIVLVPARPGVIADAVAPGLADVGVYLPPTPLQHLMLADGPAAQVMTSGNRAEEPIARTDADALDRLAGVADLFLVHDREIHARADDSVVRWSARRPIPMRRARGHVPDSIEVAIDAPPVLAVGGHERNTVCLIHDRRAIVSPHVGDLDHPEAEAFFREAIARLEELAGVAPIAVAHDLHPDYRSTRWALASGLPRIAVQHHHAHVAACLAEHGRVTAGGGDGAGVVGVAFDGTGLGDDGALWGGEWLAAELTSARRLGHLRPIALAGGDAAIRQPWRLALAALIDAGEAADLVPRVGAADRRRVIEVLASPLPVLATGAGRWFDAVAALLGATARPSYDGQAAAELEALAAPVEPGGDGDVPLEFEITQTVPFQIDLRPAIRELAHALVRGRVDRAVLAARFHATLAHAIATGCRIAGARTAVLTGGCFQNRRLLDAACTALADDGIEVLTHRRVPCNDGGLALGQAAVACARLARGGGACA